MASGLRLELSETTLAANPGGAVTTRCTVYNTSLIVDEYRLAVSGIEPSWVEMPDATSRIFPEAFETVTIAIKPPRTAGVAAGDYPFTITATSADNPALTDTATGTLTIDPFVDFGMDLDSPRQVTGEVEGAFTVRLTNTGNARLTIALDAAEETGQLDFTFADQQVQIAAGETKQAVVTARPKAQSLGTAAVYQITIGGTIVEVSPAQSVSPDLARKTTFATFQTVAGAHEPPVLSPQSVELSGQRAQTELILRNKSAIPLVMTLQASDRANALAFEFVGGDQVTVPEQGELRVPIRITCLDRTRLAAPPSPTLFTVIATPIQPSGDPRTVQGELTLPGPADFRLRLVPELVESTTPERAELTIENVSGRPATFSIAAASKDASLAVAVGAAQVEVPAQDRVSVPVELTPNAEAMGPTAGRPSGYSVRVAPVDAPSHANEVSGQYIFTPAAIAMHLKRKEIEAVAGATFDVEIENSGRGEVTVALSASDRAGACTYSFDTPQVRIDGRSSALVRLTVTPPKEHKPDARWQFDVEAKPVTPPGAAVRDAGVLIYSTATLSLTVSPPERRGRRPRKFDVILTNPTSIPMKVRLAASDRSGGLGVQLGRDAVDLPPAGRGTVKVPLKITPWKRSRGSGAAALTFNVAATPIEPPGDAVSTEGRYVALPARSRWIYLAALAIVILALLFSPLYEQAFYWAGWEKSWPKTAFVDEDGKQIAANSRSGKHKFHSDVSCIVRRIADGDAGKLRNLCFAQGPKPATGSTDIRDRLPIGKTPTATAGP
ncbi:MAG TPA: hypothetical protein VKB09_15895 [Thermomicrobiales bacterium]|nr:hypothetical protein [Thermomicrobiales bacterium]